MAPSISSLSGSAVTGSNITIVGANFGTKTRSKPLWWADFQAGSIAPHATLSYQTSFNNAQNKTLVNDSSLKRWGTGYVLESTWPRNGTSSGRSSALDMDVSTMAYGSKLYCSAWRRYVNGDTTGNWKWWRIWPAGGSGYPNSYIGDDDISNTGNRLWYTENGTPVNNVTRKYFTYQIPTATWQLDEIRLQLGSAAGVADGNLEVLVNNTSLTSDSDFAFDYSGTPGFIRRVNIQDTKANQDPGSTMRAFLDSVYIDDSWNRVYIGNNATFASCTHIEIQPYSAWSASSITVNTRLGSFSSASGLFLFVVDNSNAVTAGKALSSIGGAAAPTILSITPTSGPTAGSTAITATCTDLVSTPTVTVGGSSATSVVKVSASSMTFVTPSGSAGAKDVVVTNPDTQTGTLTGGFTYVAPPTCTAISPSSGLEDGGTAVTITGTNIDSTATVTVGGFALANTVWVSATSVTGNVPSGTSGAVNIVITNADGQTGTLTNGYTYLVAPQAPTVTSCSPTSGPQSGGTLFVLQGVGFSATPSSVTFGGVACTTFSRVNSTTIQGITPAATAAGTVNIVVTNGDSLTGTLLNGFTYTDVTVTGRRRTLAAVRRFA